VLTTDAAGNIATANIDLNRVNSDISGLRKESRQGIAAAMAMTPAPKPSAPGKTSWGTNVATYHGEVATSFAVAHMFDTNYPVILDASVGYSPGGDAGVRVGLAGEF
jgi:trimeric autotransporter adhesin